ncbi:MAG TPA: hypothetical protein VJ912_01245 [Candidatus Nanoarchaeia archaeon]|nr:hypothetical protein [Candidatus Nanoarchaeia archaeon]
MAKKKKAVKKKAPKETKTRTSQKKEKSLKKEKPQKSLLEKAVGIFAWLTGVIVSLAVGFGMTKGTLTIPNLEEVVVFFGWVVIITTLLSVLLAIIEKLRR